MFRFAHPYYLYFLVIIPVLIALFVYARYLKRKRLKAFGELETIAQLMPTVSNSKVRNKFILLCLAFIFVIFALARPQFGLKLREAKSEGIELMLAVDVSNSMMAEDFMPNRLERTKFAINQLLSALSQDRVGLIVFAGDAYVQLPITSDYITAKTFVDQISTNMISRQGTALGAAIDLASSSFSTGSEGSRVLVVISDGENHEDDALGAAKRAKEKGVTVYTIGIGTPEGAPIKIEGTNDFITDENGQMVVTKLNEQALEQIAIQTGGSYIRSNNSSVGLNEIITKIRQTETREFKAQIFDEYDEQYQYLLLVALVLLVVEFIILPRKNRILARFNIFNKN
ncbi:MAG: VWA domain-containing protein [Rikenellaceae bacterium]